MPKIYTHFEEIEKEVVEKVPQIIYKYRDWGSEYHQSILTNNTIWFSHPKELNDPYDIRVPVRFDFSEIEHPIFLKKLKEYAKERYPHFHSESREFKVVCDNHMDLIKNNPEEHFKRNYLQLRESDIYDRVGVFSLTSDALNETMWAHYGNNSRGFSVGFHTIELSRNLECGFGFVEYGAEPPVYSFIKDIKENQKDQMFLKNNKWIYEAEFRFITFRIRSERDRLVRIPSHTIIEVVLGHNISAVHQKSITELLQENYNGKVKLFKATPKQNSYGLDKVEISY